MNSPQEITKVRYASPTFEAVEFNESTIPLLLANGQLVLFTNPIISGPVTGWVRPNAGTSKRRKIEAGEVLVAAEVDGATFLSIIDADTFQNGYELLGDPAPFGYTLGGSTTSCVPTNAAESVG